MNNKQSTSGNSDRPLKVNISITLDEPLVRELRRLSDGSFRSLSQYINLVLYRHIRAVARGKTSPDKK